MIQAKVQADITGLKRLQEKLERKILRSAQTKAARIPQAAIKTEAKRIQRYGYLWRSITTKIQTYGQKVVAVIGARADKVYERGTYTKGKHKGEARRIRPSKYQHLIEKGTVRSKPRPFLEPGLNSSMTAYSNTFFSEVRKAL